MSTFNSIFTTVAPLQGARFFNELSKALELARKGKAYTISSRSTAYARKKTKPKLDHLKNGGLMVVTLTKERNGRGLGQQLRGWVSGSSIKFVTDSFYGDHADGYVKNGIFEVYGNFEELNKLIEASFIGKTMTRFENDKFVIWL